MKIPRGVIIASGPVIIEDGKVLLCREEKASGLTPWLFPGGKFEEGDESLEATCKREVQEEMGFDIEIIRPLRPMIVETPHKPSTLAILIHFLAHRLGDIQPSTDIAGWDWFPIRSLPEEAAPNVKAVIDNYLDELKRN